MLGRSKTHFLRNLHNYPNQEMQNLDENAERLGRLKPSEKVAIAIDLTDACVRICADGIRAQYPGISEEELVEKLRERLEWTKRKQTHEEDIKAILRFQNWTRK